MEITEELTRMMDLSNAARCMESLGNETRLAIYRLLVRAGPSGLPVGEVQKALRIPGSTLSHHLSHLVGAELIVQHREGRVLRCCPAYTRMNGMIEFLTNECCEGAQGQDDCCP